MTSIPPAIIIIDKEGEYKQAPKIADMPAKTQKFLKKHKITEYKPEVFTLHPTEEVGSTLTIRAIDPIDIIYFMPNLESKTEAQLLLLIRRVLHQIDIAKVPLQMPDFRERLQVEIQNSQVIHREQRPTLARAILSAPLDIFDQPNRTPILPGSLLQPGQVTVIDCQNMDQNTRRVIVIYVQLMMDRFKMQSKSKEPGLLLCIDEAEEYFGQTTSMNEKLFVNRIISKMEDVVNRGRKHKFGILLTTHTPASISRTVSDLTNIKIAFGLSGDGKWIREYFGREYVKEIEEQGTGKARLTAKISTAEYERLNVLLKIPFVGPKEDLPRDTT